MKILKTANKKQKILVSKKEWESIGKTAGWMKKADYQIFPPMDKDRYPDLEHQGLEGPFRLKSGKIVYYDTKEGRYYDKDSDMYMSDEDYFAHSEPSQFKMK